MANDTVIKVYSKNKKSLKRFKAFLEHLNKRWKNFSFYIKDRKKIKEKITVLKSPHVNKKAQAQFQSIIYSANIHYLSLDVKKNYIILKKIKNNLFPDVKIKISQTILNKKTEYSRNKIFSPKKLYYYEGTNTTSNKQKNQKKFLAINKQVKKKRNTLKKTIQFLKILDNFGHSCLK